MPLTLCNKNSALIIKRIGGSPDVKVHLNELGFNVGSEIKIISEINGNLIVNVKDCRIALDKNMASKIVV